MFNNIIADLSRYNRRLLTYNIFKKIQFIMFRFGFHAIVIYRLGKWCEKQIAPIKYPLLALYHFLELIIRFLYGIHIKRTANIGPGLYIAHLGGILLGDCTIGSNCNIAQHVIIDKDQNGSPQIGNSVVLFPHAEIIGPIQVEEGATIGAGAVIKKDVPNSCLAMGNPARILRKEYDNSAILSHGVQV